MKRTNLVLMVLLLVAGSAAAEGTINEGLEGGRIAGDRTVGVEKDAVTWSVRDDAGATDLAIDTITAPGWVSYTGEDCAPACIVMNLGSTTVGPVPLDLSCEIADDAGQVVFSADQVQSITLAPMETVAVTFDSSWQPILTGDYTVTVEHRFADDVPENDVLASATDVRVHVGTGGPDDFGYRWVDSSVLGGPQFDWIDISATGMSAITYGVSGFSGDDNFSEPIDFGFSFPFYGISYPTFHVDTNGEILLAENTWYDPYPSSGWDGDGNVFNWMYPVPGYTQMPALIAVYWDDLEADEGVGDIYVQTFGSEPDRFCVVQWHDVRFHSGIGGTPALDFEVVFHENGEIVMQYRETATGQTGTNAPHDYGQSATVAIQNECADVGLCYLRELVSGSTWVGVEPEGNVLMPGRAIRFYTGDDAQPPVIVHDAVGNTFDRTVRISAEITDLSGIAADALHFDDGSGWRAMSHTAFEAPNVYHYDLPELPLGADVSYYFSATDAAPAANSGRLPAAAPDDVFSFQVLPTAGASVVLAYAGVQDRDLTELPKYTMALDAAGVPYDLYDWQEWPDFSIPDQYQTVFVYANSSSASDITYTLSEALMAFMDGGTTANPKNVFFSSDDFAYNQSGHPNGSAMKTLLEAYFRTSYVPTGIGGGTDGLSGPNTLGFADGSILVVGGSPAGEPGTEMDVCADSPDCIFRRDSCPSWYEDLVQNPAIGAANAFAFEDGPIDGLAYLYHGVCGTYVDNLIYKAFYFSFDLSQLTSDDAIRNVIGDLVSWFDVTVTEVQDTVPVLRAELDQNFPNPFNPSTTIAFSAPAGVAEAVIEIYNARGQEVRRYSLDLASGASRYCVTWDGADDDGASTATGVYFYRLRLDGEMVTAKKMLLLK